MADFGFAQEVAEPDDGCAAVEQHTNALWVAPEVLRSHKHSNCGHYTVTKASDVYSFAAVMSEVLTGLPPFAEPDENGCVNPMQVSLCSRQQHTVLMKTGAVVKFGVSTGCSSMNSASLCVGSCLNSPSTRS